MTEMSRRTFMIAGTTLAGMISTGIARNAHAADPNSFMAASAKNGNDPDDDKVKQPGIQRIWALNEVTGGGEKVYGVAIEYDTDIDPASLAVASYSVGVIPAAKGFSQGCQQPRIKITASQKPNPELFRRFTPIPLLH
ncbi:hypothetical protein ABC733_23040 [Mangrovibacter sp. SLW1]